MTFLSQTVIGARFRIQFYPRPGQLRSIVGFNPINRPPATVFGVIVIVMTLRQRAASRRNETLVPNVTLA